MAIYYMTLQSLKKMWVKACYLSKNITFPPGNGNISLLIMIMQSASLQYQEMEQN